MVLYSFSITCIVVFFGSEHSTVQHKGQTPVKTEKFLKTVRSKSKRIVKKESYSKFIYSVIGSDEGVKVADYLLPWNLKIQICPQFLIFFPEKSQPTFRNSKNEFTFIPFLTHETYTHTHTQSTNRHKITSVCPVAGYLNHTWSDPRTWIWDMGYDMTISGNSITKYVNFSYKL